MLASHCKACMIMKENNGLKNSSTDAEFPPAAIVKAKLASGLGLSRTNDPTAKDCTHDKCLHLWYC